MISASYGQHSVAIGAALAKARTEDLMGRLRDRDHTLWSPEPDEISDRLGWLRAPAAMRKEADRVVRFAEDARARFDEVLLLGMGGSSLAAEAFAAIFGDAGGLPLRVIDTTDPDRIRAVADSTDPLRTLHVVATKSGTTIETVSAFRFFWDRVARAVDEVRAHGDADGADGNEDPGSAGSGFVAITDPGTPLAHAARDRGFREIFLNPPDVGGRYSALTYFGLVPAALVGVDVDALLTRADEVVKASLAGEDGRALGLGVALAALALADRDKLTLTTSARIAPFADWVEQLVAESTGKEGKGILPVVHEPLGPPAVYGDDRVFVDVALAADDARDDRLAALQRGGAPVVRLGMRDLDDLGGQFVLWELATAVAAAVLGVNPFDQPNVEAAKAAARDAVDAYRAGDDLPESPSTPASAEALLAFLADPAPGAYVALHAYVTPSSAADEALRDLRVALRDRFRVATTAGYGPRFLHSTGQLHKGDGGRGLFVQLSSTPRADLVIPGPDDDRPGTEGGGGTGEGEARSQEEAGRRPLTFGALRDAQAVGDRSALELAGRRVVRFDVGADAPAGIRALADGIAGEDAPIA